MHFLTIVLINPETDDPAEAVDALVAPYDEELTIDQYEWNPNGQWDWWRIGGRFNGMILNKSRRSKDGFCFGAEYENLAENSVIVSEMLQQDEFCIPRAIVTPDGEWHSRELRTTANLDWRRKVMQLYKKHINCIAVACDMHT